MPWLSRGSNWINFGRYDYVTIHYWIPNVIRQLFSLFDLGCHKFCVIALYQLLALLQAHICKIINSHSIINRSFELFLWLFWINLMQRLVYQIWDRASPLPHPLRDISLVKYLPSFPSLLDKRNEVFRKWDFCSASVLFKLFLYCTFVWHSLVPFFTFE